MIHDNLLIVQEVIYTMKLTKAREGFMTIKIDLQKAHDIQHQEFIVDTLLDMRLSISLIDGIMDYIATPLMQVLWECKVLEEFKSARKV